MKRITICLIMFLYGSALLAQSVGIGTLTPDSSALLDVSSTSKGMLMPRMTTTQRDAIEAPAMGLMILNLDDFCMDIFDGLYWIKNCGLQVVGVDSLHPPQWSQQVDFAGSARTEAVGFAIGDKGYLGTGYDGALLKDFWEYNPQQGTWTQKADLGGVARQMAVGFAIGDKGYIGTGADYGGPYLSDFWEFEPSSNTWTQKANFVGVERIEAVGFEILGKGYVGTGQAPSQEYLQDFWEYDPSSNVWTQKQNYEGGRVTQAVGFGIGNYGYLGTGKDYSTGFSDAFYVYNPQNDSWQYEPPVGGGRRRQAVGFSMQGKGYIGTGNGTAGLKKDFWEFTPWLSWVQKPDFGGTARQQAVGFSIGSKGYIGTGNQSTGATQDLWEYDPFPLTLIYAYSFNSDSAFITNSVWTQYLSKVYLSAANELNRQVGIGVSAPSNRLDIHDGSPRNGNHAGNLPLYVTGDFLADSAGVEFRRSDGTQGLGFGFNTIYAAGSNASQDIGLAAKGAAGNLIFAVNGIERWRIAGNGNFGFGVNPPNNKFDIHSGPARSGSHPGGRPMYVTGDLLEASNGIEFRHSNGTQGIGFGYNTIYATGSSFSQDLGLAAKGPQGHLVFASDGNERMRISPAGNVGIGENTPDNKLDIHLGSPRSGIHPIGRPLYVTGDFQSESGGAEFRHSNGTQGIGIGYNTIYATGTVTDQALGMVAKGSTGHLFFNTSGTERLRILGNGNVGIATATPDQLFSVANKFGVDINGSVHFKNEVSNLIYMYNIPSGITRMILSHSPQYPNWGLEYDGLANTFKFLKDSIPVMTINLNANYVHVHEELHVGYNRQTGPTVNVPFGQSANAYCDCPTGTVVLGGGYFTSSPELDVRISSTASDTQWFVTVFNQSASTTHHFYASAICARLAN